MIGRERRTAVAGEDECDSVVLGAAEMNDASLPDGASRRVRVRLARTGNACARASFTTEVRTGLFDSGARFPAVVCAMRSPRSHTESGAENGKMTSAINQQAAVRAGSESDIFV